MLEIVNVYLFWGACQDLKKKKIKDYYLWAGGIAGTICGFMELIAGRFDGKERFLAFLPGLMILIIAEITNEKIGYGDGWVLVILGNFLNLEEICRLIQGAAALAAVVSVGLLCMKKVSKEEHIPFLPFLWLAHVLL